MEKTIKGTMSKFLFIFVISYSDMAFTISDEIKRLVKVNILPADLANAIAAGENQIQAVSGLPLASWSEDDPHYGPLVTIAALWGAYTVLMGWDKAMYFDKAKQLYESYKEAVETFRKMPVSEAQVNPLMEDQIVTSEYGITVLNENIPHFLSDY